MLLENKVAIIYGGGGQIGRTVAVAYARAGASVFLAGRRLAAVDTVATEIRGTGGRAESASVDALDANSVDRHADAVAEQAGRIDISFNLVSHGDVQGTPLIEMNIDDYVNPVVAAVRSQFLTGRAAARHMIPQRSGVILMFGGDGGRDPIRDFYTGGHQIFMGSTGVAFGALDVMRRQLAVELGPHGIRVLTIESAGVPETVDPAWREMMTPGLAAGTMLKQAETLADVADVAVFAASDMARSLTATSLNMTRGKIAD